MCTLLLQLLHLYERLFLCLFKKQKTHKRNRRQKPRQAPSPEPKRKFGVQAKTLTPVVARYYNMYAAWPTIQIYICIAYKIRYCASATANFTPYLVTGAEYQRSNLDVWLAVTCCSQTAAIPRHNRVGVSTPFQLSNILAIVFKVTSALLEQMLQLLLFTHFNWLSKPQSIKRESVCTHYETQPPMPFLWKSFTLMFKKFMGAYRWKQALVHFF